MSASGSLPDVEWFSPEGVHIDWYAADASLTCFLCGPSVAELEAENHLGAGGVEGTPRHVLIFAHAGSLPRTFQFPRSEPLRALRWHTFLQTGQAAPDDVFPGGDGPVVDVNQPLELPARSLVCLVADTAAPPPPLPPPAPARRRIARRRS